MLSFRSEQEFQNLLRRLQLALEASKIGVWEHDISTDEIRWDLQMHRLYETGRVDRKVTPDAWANAIHPEDHDRAIADFVEAIQRKGAYSSDFRIVLPGGDIRYLRSRAHYFEENGVATVIGAEWDVTADVLLNRALSQQKAIAEEKAEALAASQNQIEHAANHDYLTGLPNRRSFDRRLSELLDDTGLQRLAMLHVDLDSFKQINDTYGHAAGDTVLRCAATVIADAIPPGSFAARVGGDEFVVLIPDFSSLDQLATVTDHIVRVFAGGVTHAGKRLATGLSIGVAWADSGQMATLLADCDLALYSAKKLGRSRVEFFSPALGAELSQDRLLTAQLKAGISANELVPFYQIQVDARTRQPSGIEALVRWRHPQHGLLSPESFLHLVGDAELTADLDATMLAAVLADRARWKEAGLIIPRTAVNISTERLSDPGLIDQLTDLRIEPDTISFELLETILLDDIDATKTANLDALKAMRIDIEVDDFGSGHASIIALVRIKPKRLKIDRRLVTPITTSTEQGRLIASIVEIAKALDIEVVAEGVETPAHADILAALGCRALQGYAIAAPVAAADLPELLAQLRAAA